MDHKGIDPFTSRMLSGCQEHFNQLNVFGDRGHVLTRSTT